VLSGVGDPDRARRGMTAAYFRLVDRQAGLVKLFDPPFDRSELEPGYIKGYVPGVRENGGQYTHAAVWTAMAFAELGDRERAWELTRLINPVGHGHDAQAIARYQVEPYVVSADVYAVPPHAGPGGWSWYTGSAGWMYRLITESLLGLKLRDGRLAFAPRTPDSWSGFKAQYRHHDTLYRIEVVRVAGAERVRVTLDGAEQPADDIALANDLREHAVRVEHG
jgi:cellobiose phosphorylase